MSTTRKRHSKWDVPPRRGEFDYLLKEIRDETARQAPPHPPEERGGGGPRVHIEIVVPPLAQPIRRNGYRFGTITGWIILLAIVLAMAGCAAQPVMMSAACRAEPVCRDNPSWYDNSIGLNGIQYRRQQAADEAARSRRHADPVWQANWQAMMQDHTRKLLRYYAQHPEADPAYSTYRCNSTPSYDRVRTECSNDAGTSRIEGWSN